MAPDLDALCVDLLRRDPELRPPGEEVLQRLGAAPPSGPGTQPSSQTFTQTPPFVGRETELVALEEAFRAVQEGRPAAVLVDGEAARRRVTRGLAPPSG
ncbi:MAG: hypothetical protein HY906_21035 [Deltaproteobacteria bacterium]|nr:hypothetical protein [Deltaproteobacteria bacterium]